MLCLSWGASPAWALDPSAPAASSLVDLNAATQAQLEKLPGVGKATASKIIAGRPYRSVDELASKGVPDRTIQMIRPLVTVGGSTTSQPASPSSAAVPKTPRAAAPGTAATTGALVDLNTASESALQALPGVGPATSKAIVAARPFASVDELAKVKGIGPAKLGALRNLVTVSGAHAPSVAPSAPPVPAPASPRPSTMPSPPAAAAPSATPASPRPSTMPSPPAAAAPSATASRPSASAAKLAPGQKVNINTASLAELEALPGIGPVKAQKIIDGRPYAKPEDVMKVSGIKEGVFAKLRDFITVQ